MLRSAQAISPVALRCRCSKRWSSTSSSARQPDMNSGFTGTYDPAESGRGPMFNNKRIFGVPQFYPRDLKRRVDSYVVGQDRAKKTICSTIFNHYQNLRRRHQHEHEERNLQEKSMRQRFARDRELHQKRREVHPVDGTSIRSHSSLQSANDSRRIPWPCRICP